jgi:ribosomal protein L35AE/L33A
MFVRRACRRAKNEIKGTKFRTIWGKVTRSHGKG